MDNSIDIKDSILTSVKKMLGITAEYNSFDDEIIMHINSIFMILYQLGVGPEKGFLISDASIKWEDYIKDSLLFNYLKPYFYLQVKLVFDPSSSTNVSDSMARQITEYEWRIKTYLEDFITQEDLL